MFTKLKNFSYLIVAAMIALTSCGGDDEETPLPTLVINTNSLGSDQTGGTASTGTKVTINLTANATEEIAKLNALKAVGGAGSSLPGYPVTSGFNSKTSHTWNAEYTITETSGTVVLTFSVEDKKGKIASKTFTITVGAPASTINSYSAKIMNNQVVNPGSSFYSVQEDKLYNLTTAKANSAKIDFCHALRSSANGGRIICAPLSDDANAIFDADGTNPDRISQWAVKNATKFKSIVLSEAQFTALASAADLTAQTGAANTITDPALTTLDNGTTFAFVLANGKRGIARVTAVTGPAVFTTGAGSANEGSITLSVKVEK